MCKPMGKFAENLNLGKHVLPLWEYAFSKKQVKKKKKKKTAGHDKDISSIFPHFPVLSLIFFSQIFFTDFFLSLVSGWMAWPPRKALAMPLVLFQLHL